jgi:hypothetical protein
MKDKYYAKIHDAEFEAVQSELLLNLIALVKLQQLNIELLWEAFASGKAPVTAMTQMRESGIRLADSMERVHGMMVSNDKCVN